MTPALIGCTATPNVKLRVATRSPTITSARTSRHGLLKGVSPLPVSLNPSPHSPHPITPTLPTPPMVPPSAPDTAVPPQFNGASSGARLSPGPHHSVSHGKPRIIAQSPRRLLVSSASGRCTPAHLHSLSLFDESGATPAYHRLFSIKDRELASWAILSPSICCIAFLRKSSVRLLYTAPLFCSTH